MSAAPVATPMRRIAYLAPEIPALSATFVYEEMLAVERRGMQVVPYSVHTPIQAAPDQRELQARTRVLYGGGLAAAAAGLRAAFGFGHRSGLTLQLLLGDMLRVRPWRVQAWKLFYQALAGARLAREMITARVEHLHVHFAHVPAQIAMYASAFSGIPFTVTAHANDIFERALLLPQKARRATMLLTISKSNVDHLKAQGVPPERLAIVRCGVSLAPRLDAPTFERKDSYRVGSLGRLVEKKGMGDLIRAMAVLRDAPWSWELSIAGDGPQRAALEELANKLGLASQVRFVGPLAHAHVGAWLRSLDAFALACKVDPRGDKDGIPVVLMEAMSQWVPVVSTRLSGIPELVIHEQTGLLAEAGQPEDIAAQLRRLLESPALREQLGRAAVHHVETEFGQEVNVDRLLRFLPPLSSSAPAP